MKEELIFQNVENPIISIIVPVDNNWDTTYDCLRSVLFNTKGISYEIIILDNSPCDDSINIQRCICNINVVNGDTKKGIFSDILFSSRGKYLLFLKNNTTVSSGWLWHLVDTAEKDETIGIIGPKLLLPDGKLFEAGGIIWRDGTASHYGWGKNPKKSRFNYLKEVDFISCVSLMIHSNLWRKLGGSTEQYPANVYGAADLAFEARRHGYKVIYQPKSEVVYHELGKLGSSEKKEEEEANQKSRGEFIDKWKEILGQEHFQNNKHIFWARDRSRNKKTILVFSLDGPDFDKSTASRMTYHYLKLFVEMGLHVVFIGNDYSRIEPYASVIEQLGIQVLYGKWSSKEEKIKKWIKAHANKIDYAYLIFPFIADKYMEFIKHHTKAKIIYNASDLFYLRERRNYELVRDPKLLESSKYWETLEFKLFETADVIHVVSAYEQELLKNALPYKTIRHVPVYIYDDSHPPKNGTPFEQREGILFVGTFTHKPNIDGIMWFVTSIFPRIVEKIPMIKFFIVGPLPPDEIKILNSERIIVTGHVTDQELEKYYNNCRLVIAPLRFGAGVKGKVVEALYHQVPIVTTNIGAEGLKDIDHYVAIGDQENEFADKVIEIYSSEKQWEKLSLSSKVYIERYFSVIAAREQIDCDISL